MAKFPYELVGIESKNGKYPFRIVDTKEDLGLYMIHYDVDEIGNTDKEDKNRFLRGTIVSEENGVIVPSFGYTPTIVRDSFPDDENEILTDKDGKTHTLKDFGLKSVFPMFDGTLLRVWKYKDIIYVSTHRKIDASNSRWGTSGKFVDLFKKYIESSFKLEDLFRTKSAKSDSEDIKIHNFLLVDSDLMICSKLPLDTKVKEGFVLYINSVNCTLPNEILEKVPEVKYTEIADTVHTVIRVQSFKTMEEYNSYLNKGFYPDKEDIHPQISLGEGLILFNGKTMLKIVSKGYNKRAKIVNNDPNILHRVYEILTDTQMSKDGMDNFLEKYPALPCPNDEQIEAFKHSIISKFPEDWKTPSDQELTENTDRETREFRLRCAITHYALSLPVCYQKSALTCIKELINDRYTAINIVTNSYSKFEKQQYNDFNPLGHTGSDGTVNPRDLKVFERIRQIVIDAKNYANVRIKRGESIKGINGNQLFNKFTKDNIRNLMLKEYGTSLYKMVRVLVSDPKKKNE